MRTESAGDFKTKRGGAPKQKIPREGSRTRELWDLLQTYKGEVLELPLTTMFSRNYIAILTDFYGLDIRKLGTIKGGKGAGTGFKGSKWILAGEWFGKEYVDYIAKNKQKLKVVEKIISNERTKNANKNTTQP